MEIHSSFSRRTTLRGIAIGLLSAASAGCSAVGETAIPAAKTKWATGGTAAMKGAANYPNPFTLADQACQITCEQILGPCWAKKAPVRQDVSEGEPGIPMRMALRLLEADGCTPLVGAEVEIWHANHNGVYSGDDVEGGDFCTADSAYAEARYYHRGRAICGADGIAIFDSCFPGWYHGRALHIHLLVRMPEHAGEEHTNNIQTVTQLYFPEELTEEIHANTDGYNHRGQPDTKNSTDFLLPGDEGAAPFTFRVEQMEDGAMLACKTINVSQSESCGSREITFPEGFTPPPGGMPPGGPPPAGFSPPQGAPPAGTMLPRTT